MAFPDKSTTKGFPKPYLDTANIEDPIMKRVDVHKGEIGSRSSGLPQGVASEGMGIEHVGGSTGSNKS
jgi:hypothetical protein